MRTFAALTLLALAIANETSETSGSKTTAEDIENNESIKMYEYSDKTDITPITYEMFGSDAPELYPGLNLSGTYQTVKDQDGKIDLQAMVQIRWDLSAINQIVPGDVISYAFSMEGKPTDDQQVWETCLAIFTIPSEKTADILTSFTCGYTTSNVLDIAGLDLSSGDGIPLTAWKVASERTKLLLKDGNFVKKIGVDLSLSRPLVPTADR